MDHSVFLISPSGFWFPNLCDFSGSNCPVSSATSEVERVALMTPTQHVSLWGRHLGPVCLLGSEKGLIREREQSRQYVEQNLLPVYSQDLTWF